jgi:AraC-like DNA-binding protein
VGGIYEWHRLIQTIVDEIDYCIEQRDDEALTLRFLSRKLGYSEFHTTRKFKEISGMQFRDYLRLRRLAFALVEVRDKKRLLLEIALDYGFSSHEAFTRAFKAAYGVTPKEYRKNPMPVVLLTKIGVFDRYFLGLGEIGMIKSSKEVKVYFVSMPAHKFLHVKNYGSIGYWEFWEHLDKVPETNCDRIAGLLDSITGKLDGEDGVVGKFNGQIMARINEGSVTAEAYGIRLPADYSGEIPTPMLLINVPASEYIVFEHGSFDYEQ